MIPTLLIIGATGDLTSRLLVPALGRLRATGTLPPDFRLVGAAFDDWTDDAFRSHVHRAATEVSADAAQWLAGAAAYRQLDVTDADAVRRVVTETVNTGPVGVYIALPTALVEPALDALSTLELPPGSRIAVEKPFGTDARSADILNTLLLRAVGDAREAGAYRVDHALGMTTVHNLSTLRFSNRLFADTWNSDHIEQIDVLWDETLALEGRASYYDKAGALRDVMQNHQLQVLCIAAMEPPSSSATRDVHAAKLDLLRHLRVMRRPDGTLHGRRARYTSGIVDGSHVPDYADEPGVDPRRKTETLAEVHLLIDTPRWRGTTFVLHAAKALAETHKGIRVHYRHVERSADREQSAARRSTLWIGIEGPDELRLDLLGSSLGPPASDQPISMSTPVPPAALPPYGFVLQDFLSGGQAHSVVGDEAVEAWRIFDPVLHQWSDDDEPLDTYPAGTPIPTLDPTP
jgi:glucose-6-phosphate 1-dehydrogenase